MRSGYSAMLMKNAIRFHRRNPRGLGYTPHDLSDFPESNTLSLDSDMVSGCMGVYIKPPSGPDFPHLRSQHDNARTRTSLLHYQQRIRPRH